MKFDIKSDQSALIEIKTDMLIFCLKKYKILLSMNGILWTKKEKVLKSFE